MLLYHRASLRFQIIFKASSLGNILKIYNIKSVCYFRKHSVTSNNHHCSYPQIIVGLRVTPGHSMASSGNMSYLLGSLDWQDLIEVERPSSGKTVWAWTLSRATEVLKGKPWNSKWQNFSWGSQMFSPNLRSMPRAKFHFGGLLSTSRQRSRIITKHVVWCK